MGRTEGAKGKKQIEKRNSEAKGQTKLAFGNAGGLAIQPQINVPTSVRGMIGSGFSVFAAGIGLFASSSSSSSGAVAAHVSTRMTTEDTGSNHFHLFTFFHLFVLSSI